ncbi:MAG: hypothetical protein M1305_05845 [Candidatus Marsarchaeota archaeon]|jgi:hypothetical protein|nr:hypothetical protein [Candidatus Marsarchaeota archaeon]MCL5419360.1 hypothetical protein [Candidatus Marsarchaeota archaeon]
MGEYAFSCACGYTSQHANIKEVLKEAEKHGDSCSMAWDVDIRSLEAAII